MINTESRNKTAWNKCCFTTTCMINSFKLFYILSRKHIVLCNEAFKMGCFLSIHLNSQYSWPTPHNYICDSACPYDGIWVECRLLKYIKYRRILLALKSISLHVRQYVPISFRKRKISKIMMAGKSHEPNNTRSAWSSVHMFVTMRCTDNTKL